MQRRMISLGILLVFLFSSLFLGTGPVVRGADADAPASQDADRLAGTNRHVSEALMQTLQQQDRIRVIVQLDTSFVPEGKITRGGVRSQRAEIASSQDHISKSIRNSASAEIHRFRTVPLLVMQVDAAGLQALMNDPRVVSIREDKVVPPLLEEVVPMVGADQVWAEGFQGTGQAVAVLDTGVDTDHNFLVGKTVSEACYSTTDTLMGSVSLCPAGDNPSGTDTQVGTGAGVNCDTSLDGCDHGTHVAGIVLGSGDPVYGVAPGASLISIQVFSRFEGTICTESGLGSPCTMSYTSDQIRALERIYELRTTHSIAAVNMSLGGEVYTDQEACDTAETDIKYIIDQLRSVDIPVVISAGNGSSRSGLSAPGCVSSAVSVGSVELDDSVASYSNTAPFLDYYAPGSGVYSSLPDDAFGNKSGTSMAAPVVAGAFALLKEGAPSAPLDEILAALDDTGVPVDDQRTGGSVTGIPRIQVDEAYFSLLPRVFDDVAYDHWAVEHIEALYDAGYVSGCSTDPPLYCPSSTMSRGEGAVFVERGIHGGGYLPDQPTETVFSDVDLEQWYAKWAQALWDDNYTDGCGTDPLIFCPESGHTRAEGAVFYLRMLNGPEYFPPDPTESVFSDVDLEQWYAKWVEQAYAEGIFLPCQTEPELLACPLDPLLRDVAAWMMVQAKGGLPLGSP